MIRQILPIALIVLLTSCMSSKKKIKPDAFKEGDTHLLSEDKAYFSMLPKKKSREIYLKKIKKSFEENPTDRDLLLKLMDAHFFLGNYREAYKYGKKALAYQVAFLPLKLKLAHISLIQGRLSYVRHILASLDCSRNSDCLNLKGMLAYKERNVEEAQKYWTKSLEIDSGNTAVVLNLASFYLEFYRPKMALSILERLSDRAKRNTNVMMLLTLLKKMPKHAEDAQDLFETVREKHKYNPLLLHNLALSFLKQKDYDDALESIKKSLKYAPRYNLAIDRSLRLESEIKRLRDKDD